MRRFSQKHSFSTLSEINVTPLLDLAFVLLIIFIITTPLMDKSVDLVMPSSAAAKNSVEPGSVQTISINREQVIKLNNNVVALDEPAPARGHHMARWRCARGGCEKRNGGGAAGAGGKRNARTDAGSDT